MVGHQVAQGAFSTTHTDDVLHRHHGCMMSRQASGSAVDSHAAAMLQPRLPVIQVLVAVHLVPNDESGTTSTATIRWITGRRGCIMTAACECELATTCCSLRQLLLLLVVVERSPCTLRLMTPITRLLASTTGSPDTLLSAGMMSSSFSLVLAVSTLSTLRMRPGTEQEMLGGQE